MITVTFNFDTAAQAAAFLQDFDSPAGDAGTGAPAGDKRPRGRPRKEVAPVAADPTPAAAAPAPTAAPAATPTPAPTAAPAPAAVPFAALVDPLTKLADTDLDAALAILGKYGVKTARELKPEQFGSVLAEVNAALNKPAARPSLI